MLVTALSSQGSVSVSARSGVLPAGVRDAAKLDFLSDQALLDKEPSRLNLERSG